MKCSETMQSRVNPDHQHTCNGMHDSRKSHFCAECRRWWWRK